MILKRVCILAAATAFLGAESRAELITSFENDLEGWTISATDNAAYAFNGFSTSTGVTEGTYSAVVTGTAAPSYGQLLVGPFSTELTDSLATAESLAIDVTTEAGAFDWGSQWTAIVNNADLGYASLDGYSYSGFVGPGSFASLSWDLTSDQRATLAASAEPTQIVFQVGGGGPGTMYVDNVRLSPVPEPASALLAALGVVAWAARGRFN